MYTKTLRTILPLQPGDDQDLALWLARESFERVAANELLQITDFSHRTLDASDIPPKAEKQLGKKLDSFVWVEYSGTASRAAVL